MHFYDSVHNGDVSFLDLENNYLPRLDWVTLKVGEKEEVPAMKSWLHTPTEREREREEGRERGREGGRESEGERE